MKYFNLANYNASRVAQGCMRIASLDKKEIDTLIKTDLDCGINFFDHADIYGGGECERKFGEFLKDNPEREAILNGEKRFDANSAREIYKELNFLPNTQWGYSPCICGRKCDMACYKHIMEVQK